MAEVSFESVECLSQADFAQWVEARAGWDLNHYELLNGRIVMTPPAGYPHGRVGSRLGRILDTFVSGRNLGEVLDSSQGYDLPSGDTVEPDASFISTARMEAGPAPETGKFLRVVPNLVVETLSPTTSSRDRGEKKAIYERNGVDEYWLVDWRACRITRFLLRDGRYDAGTRFEAGAVCESAVLAGLAFPVDEVFRK